MAITQLRADQQVSQSSITENELSSSVVGNGLQGAEGTALSVKNDGTSIVVGASGIKAGGGVVSGSAQVTGHLPDGTVSGSAQTIENLPDGTISGSAQVDVGATGTGVSNFNTAVKAKMSTEGTITGSSQVDVGSTGTGVSNFNTAVKAKMSTEGTITGSSQVDVGSTGTGVSNFNTAVKAKMSTEGVVSGSSQVQGGSIDYLLQHITASGNISASGYISASSFYGEFVEISSSVQFSSGSTIFGDDANDSHEFTGSVTLGNSLAVGGNVNLNSNVILGDANTDDITITGRIDANTEPSGNNLYNLGAAANAWKDLHVSGTAYIQTLNADGFSIGGGGSGNTGVFTTVDATNLFASGGKLDNIVIGGTTTNSGSFVGTTVTGKSTLAVVDINGGAIDGTIIGANSAVAGTFTNLTTTGNVILGNSEADTIDVWGVLSGSLVPETDNAFDLGASGKEFKDLYIDGTANIDVLSASSANIEAGTIDGITSLTAGGNLDIGSHNFTAGELLSDGLTSGRVLIAGASGIISDDSDMTFSGDKLTVTKISASTADFDSGTFTELTSLTVANDVNIGAHKLTANQLESDISTGTPPLVITSTDKVANLNVDKLDDQEGVYYLTSSNFEYTNGGAHIPTSAIDGTLSQWTSSDASGIHRYGKVMVSGSSTKHVTFNEGDITASGAIYKETLMNSFKFGVTASWKEFSSPHFIWFVSESIKFGSELIFVNGILQDSGSGNDYTIVAKGNSAPDSNITHLRFNYKVPQNHSKVKIMYVPNGIQD